MDSGGPVRCSSPASMMIHDRDESADNLRVAKQLMQMSCIRKLRSASLAALAGHLVAFDFYQWSWPSPTGHPRFYRSTARFTPCCMADRSEREGGQTAPPSGRTPNASGAGGR